MPYLYVLYRTAARLISYSEPDFQHGGVAKLFAKIRGAHIPSSLQIRDLSLRLSNAAHHFCVPRFRYVTGESEGMNA